VNLEHDRSRRSGSHPHFVDLAHDLSRKFCNFSQSSAGRRDIVVRPKAGAQS
jgi:hypothetical protein